MNNLPGREPIPDDMPQPIFVLAPQRSYSTVTLAILAGHPGIYGFPELLLFSAPLIGDVLAGKVRFSRRDDDGSLKQGSSFRAGRFSGLYRAVADVHEHSQESDAIQRAYSWLQDRLDWPTEQLYDHLISQVRPLAAVEKSPDTVACDLNLMHCLDSYPSARLIHLTRHPVGTMMSIREQYEQLYAEGSDRAKVIESATVWYKAHLRISNALSKLPADRWYRIHAEDLVGEPERHLPPILEWLGLPGGDEVIAQMLRTDSWRFAGKGPSGQLWGGDPKFLANPHLRPIQKQGSLDDYPLSELPAEMLKRIKMLCGFLGYV